MSKKHKCCMCENSMHWSLPERVTPVNIDYAKRCLRLAKNTIVCDRTHKTKGKNHEQYCKYYRNQDADYLKFCVKRSEEEIQNLEKLIAEYEKGNTAIIPAQVITLRNFISGRFNERV